jgi:hypothetical protein
MSLPDSPLRLDNLSIDDIQDVRHGIETRGQCSHREEDSELSGAYYYYFGCAGDDHVLLSISSDGHPYSLSHRDDELT